MSYWNDPQYIAWHVLFLIGSLPLIVMEMVVGVWALRQLIHRPQPARWMLVAVALLMFWQFGAPNVLDVVNTLLFRSGFLTGSAWTEGIFLLYLSAYLGFTVAIWWCSIRAVFGREESEWNDVTPIQPSAAPPSGEQP
jgi:hypothetical protein